MFKKVCFGKAGSFVSHRCAGGPKPCSEKVITGPSELNVGAPSKLASTDKVEVPKKHQEKFIMVLAKFGTTRHTNIKNQDQEIK